MRLLMLNALLFYLAFSLMGCLNNPANHTPVAPASPSPDSLKIALLDSFRLVKVEEVDSMMVMKSERLLFAYDKGKLVKVYRINLGSHPVGDKQVQGDGKTPEGLYFINDRNPNSAYHKNLGISYPNDDDRTEAHSLGKSPGGDIKVHGLPNDYTAADEVFYDWTDGCINVSNSAIDELYEAVKMGSPILIKP